MKKLMIIGAASLFAFSAMAKDKPKEEEKLICDARDKMEKVLADKGFYHLLNMTNNNKVVEEFWIAGQSVTILAQVPKTEKETTETTCLLAVMDNVIYNSETITGLYKAMEKQTKQKEI